MQASVLQGLRLVGLGFVLHSEELLERRLRILWLQNRAIMANHEEKSLANGLVHRDALPGMRQLQLSRLWQKARMQE